MATQSLLEFPIESHINEFGPLSILALYLLPIGNVDAGIFSRITMTSMTSQWYLRLSHFEALLLGLVVLQVFVMRYFLILPLDVTKLIEDGTLLGTSVSRKKRQIISKSEIMKHQRLAESMFAIIRRLDENDCVLKTLCELEVSSNEGRTFSRSISELLSDLKILGYKRIRDESLQTPSNVTLVERTVFSVFEDAVLFGTGDKSFDCENEMDRPGNSTCALQYALCQSDQSELLDYVQKIQPFLL